MFNNKLYSAIFITTLTLGSANASIEITGKLTHESAILDSGTLIGNNTTLTPVNFVQTNVPIDRDSFKKETSARIYVDGDLESLIDDTTFHMELQAYNNSGAIAGYDDNKSYTQRDALREAYVDTSVGDWLLRAGKQQVVWGTADGIKLLDAINPTDYTELVQNSPEDSRIPVWMLNADKNLDNGGNFQVVVSQHKPNIIAGMGNASSANTVHSNGDKGHPFIMKGVDTITGRVNGFLNIAADIGATAAVFNGGFGPLKDNGFTLSTVGEFFGNMVPAFSAGAGCTNNVTTAACMSGFAGNAYSGAGTTTRVLNASAIDATYGDGNEGGTNPTSAFAMMSDATFGTFQSFANAKSRYKVDHHDMSNSPNVSLRYKNTTENGLNYSFNFMDRVDPNPYVFVQWEDENTHDALTQTVTSATGDGNNTGNNADKNGRVYRTVSLPSIYGWQNSGGYGSMGRTPVLSFHEKLNKVKSIGGSFDTTLDTESLGAVVVRGEVLFNKDEMKPRIDRNKMAYGDLPGALTMVKSDTASYVIGVDVTAMTNMLISGQFIQMINLDHIDNKTDADGNACSGKVNCGIYTGDMASMHMTNGLQKAEEYKEFYSLYLSKPFGESGQHRWNNIFMFEENNGKWNRFDVEYTVDDNTQLTAELNSYWGNPNTQFGQMSDSSNVQVGLKYTF